MLAVSTHRFETPFEGDARAAFDVARTALLSQGFEIIEDSGSEFRAQGPGMHSTQQSAILGVTELRLRAAASTLQATATLGGVATMKRFVVLFPPGLILSLALPALLMGQGLSWTPLLCALPWLLIAPWLSSLLEVRTTRAVERLLRGMALAGARR